MRVGIPTRRPRKPGRARPWLVAALLWAVACAPARQTTPADGGSFAGLIEQLSEPGGFFDTDNLISNESSYLHALGPLRRHGVRGGGYIGVGPDQNFSYIAEIRPEIAYLLDLRRDNLLLHLLFKAIMEEASNRTEYLGLLFGRSLPADLLSRGNQSADQLVAAVDSLVVTEASAFRARARVDARMAGFGVRLSKEDLATIERFHREFMAAGLDLRFTSFGRGPRPLYPTYRELVQARDLAGEQGSFLSSEARYLVVRDLQLRDRIIPVVGDLAGPHALAAIGRDLAGRGLTVSALYLSNVEFYLWGDRSFDRFAETTLGLPSDAHSVIIRSWFGRTRLHPDAVPGHLSTALVQTFDAFRSGVQAGFPSYWDLATRNHLPPRE